MCETVLVGKTGKRDGAGRRYGFVYVLFINICIANAISESGAHDLTRAESRATMEQLRVVRVSCGVWGVGRGATWAMGEARAARLQRRRDAKELDESQEEAGLG